MPNRKRPVFLNLFQIRLPVTGVVSIIHRATGVVLALAIPLFLYVLQRTLADPGAFDAARSWLGGWPGRALTLLVVWMLVQHLYSGIRHLLLDIDVGISLRGARRGAWLVFVAAIVTVALLGAAA